MKLKTAEVIQNVLWAVVGISLIIAYLSDKIVFVIIGMIAFGMIIAVRALFWKCPYCGKYIGRDKGIYCKNCGKELK